MSGATASIAIVARATSAVLALAVLTSVPASADDSAPFPALFGERAVFSAAITQERLQGAPQLRVTGIAVPHHLLAADLIARGFWAAAGNQYNRVIILSPDHFNRSRKPLATTRRDFETVFGRIGNDRAATSALLETADLFDDSGLFEHEHGIAALTPFVKHFFPDAKIVPVTISYRASRADWDRALELLVKLTGPRVLVVQSTDYSHFLPASVAMQRDQETLNIIAAQDVEAL